MAPGSNPPTIGSLFSGYGGLDMAVHEAIGGSTAWVSDIDPGACKILAHRFPGVPNLGDITAVDWTSVEPVDVLTGGFPCQDVSAAGKRLGIRPGTRSGLWTQMAYAIDQLRPSLVVIENVRGLLSAPAHSDLEPCPWCVGDDEHVTLRALGAVLGDLADLGYDASWQGLRASDVGAPHGRFRVFVVAWPAADASSNRRHEGWTEPARIIRGSDAAVGGAVVQDADRSTRGERRLAAPGQAQGWGARADARGRDRTPAADTNLHGRAIVRRELHLERDVDGRCSSHTAWGPFESAVRRWERLTRPAPRPREMAKNGERLSPRFVEWMQGLPEGWVTDPAIWVGMKPNKVRDAQLHALGNGVVPAQAAQALRMLLPDVGEVAA